MLEPHRAILSTQRIVLASSSPRREEILSKARLPSFEIVPPECEENLDRAAYADAPWKYAVDTAHLKARDVFQRLKGTLLTQPQTFRKSCLGISASQFIAGCGV